MTLTVTTIDPGAVLNAAGVGSVTAAGPVQPTVPVQTGGSTQVPPMGWTALPRRTSC